VIRPPANLVWHRSQIDPEARARRNGHPGAVVWLTGLPGSGKSTLAFTAEARLHALGWQTAVLDGDNIRHGLCADLGFSLADRQENMRRTGEAARLFAEHGVVVFVSLVSPLAAVRDAVRQRLPEGRFLEVWCRCPLEVCQQRDPKGLYAKAAQGLIPDFTGVSSPYQAPLNAELEIDTAAEGSETSVLRLTSFLLERLQDSITL
jgi:adenylylsulfate kinase